MACAYGFFENNWNETYREECWRKELYKPCIRICPHLKQSFVLLLDGSFPQQDYVTDNVNFLNGLVRCGAMYAHACLSSMGISIADYIFCGGERCDGAPECEVQQTSSISGA